MSCHRGSIKDATYDKWVCFFFSILEESSNNQGDENKMETPDTKEEL